MRRRMADSFFIQQQIFIISFCLTKLTDGHGKFNGQLNLRKEWLFGYTNNFKLNAPPQSYSGKIVLI